MTLGFAIALGLACGIIFGLAPAFQLARLDAQQALRALDRSNPPPDITALVKQFDLRGQIATALREKQKKGG